MSNVEVGITHQVKNGRESAWIKVSVNLDYTPDKPGYTISDAIDEASVLVNNKVIDVIEQTVATVNNYEGAK